MLIEKITKKIEIDEHDGSHIHVRETTHLVDSISGDMVHENVKHFRYVISPDDDIMASEKGLALVANEVWTPAVRQEQRRKLLVIKELAQKEQRSRKPKQA